MNEQVKDEKTMEETEAGRGVPLVVPEMLCVGGNPLRHPPRKRQEACVEEHCARCSYRFRDGM